MLNNNKGFRKTLVKQPIWQKLAPFSVGKRAFSFKGLKIFMNTATKRLARAGIISALYVILSMITFPIASGVIQFRLSEALCVLALFYFEAPFALAIGCMLSNLITGCTPLDIVFGSVITLIAGIITFICGKTIKNTVVKIILGGLAPVLLNAFLLPVIWIFIGVSSEVYIIQVISLTVSQSVSIYGLGTLLALAIIRLKKKVRFFS